MVDTPFQQPQDLNNRQNRVLALSGVFEAAQLTHLTAMAGMSSIKQEGNFYFEQMIKASLNIRPHKSETCQTMQFFSSITDLSLGLQLLEHGIHQPFHPLPKKKISKLQHIQIPFKYALSLLQLEKKVYRNKAFVEKIEQVQQQILKQLSFFDQNYLHPSIIANLAQAYVETAGQIEPRILIRGNGQAFKDQQHTNKIRACLFTGLQMAHLWRQLNGRSSHLIFGKRKILQDVQFIAKKQYQLIKS